RAAQCTAAPSLSTTCGARQLGLQAPPSVSPPVAAPDAAARRRQWEADRTHLIDAMASTRVRAATAMVEGDTEVDLDVPPWRKGRAGTSIGRAVHATLQTVDLATGAGLAAIAAAQAVAEGVDQRVDDIERLA